MPHARLVAHRKAHAFLLIPSIYGRQSSSASRITARCLTTSSLPRCRPWNRGFLHTSSFRLRAKMTIPVFSGFTERLTSLHQCTIYPFSRVRFSPDLIRCWHLLPSPQSLYRRRIFRVIGKISYTFLV